MKHTHKIIFLTVFLDILGFSVIFPLFPALLKHYTLSTPDDPTLLFFLELTKWLASDTSNSHVPIVVFGGILGSVYSLLQFLCAPFWGALSDRIGRRPVLLFTLTGLLLSYIGWFFAGTFTLLVAARTLGGMMAGNISTATAAIADVTDEKSRSSGMAIVGIAFGMGFLIGPALGGLFTLWDLSLALPQLRSWGVNPFSLSALFSALLCLLNIALIVARFEETFPVEKRKMTHQKPSRTLNIFAVTTTRTYPGVFLVIMVYFGYLIVFSGMEFSLTFLTEERFQFQPIHNGLMFFLMGIVMALVQGGVVRRSASRLGEKNMAAFGLACIIPGLTAIGVAHHLFVLSIGLFLLAVGAAMVTPCLTSLVSLYTPAHEQGRILGLFRSMGALSRALGPFLACLLYWKFSSLGNYLIGSLFLVIPLIAMTGLPARKET